MLCTRSRSGKRISSVRDQDPWDFCLAPVPLLRPPPPPCHQRGLRLFGTRSIISAPNCRIMTTEHEHSGLSANRRKVERTDEEWKRRLTPEQYHILREKGTEPAFAGEYNINKEKGTYLCAGCGNELFSSDTKYDSGSGWPSFHEPRSEGSVETKGDRSLWMKRTEIVCERCGGHLGHVFGDGPKPTGLRYCINSSALRFRKEE